MPDMEVTSAEMFPKDIDMDTCDDSPPGAKKAKKSPPKKKKKGLSGSTFPLQPPKNPVALLNELRQNLTFDLVSQTGPVHAPVFTMKVIVSCSSLPEERTGQPIVLDGLRVKLIKIMNY